MTGSVMKSALSPLEAARALEEFWSPRVIAALDDYYVKVARLKGSFTWHSHEGEDELFLVLQGKLRIEFENGQIELKKGDLYVVPRGMRHHPVAQEECLVMLVERKSTQHTGAVRSGRTRDITEQLSGFKP